MAHTHETSIFVFGSNTAGRHGKGAALYAAKNCGAVYGVGEGLTGRSYALPTKDEQLRTRPWEEIIESIDKMLHSARENAGSVYVLTPVGCGLAGLDVKRMANVIRSRDLPPNLVLHTSWLDHM